MNGGNLLSHLHTAVADYLPQVPRWPPHLKPTRDPGPSGPSARSSAAVLIQSAARGLLARKALRDLQSLEADVAAVERRVQRTLDLLLVDDRERLLVNETLMAVLLRLDSVRGARGYRAKIIRRTIALQETLDAIVSGGDTGPPPPEEEDSLVGRLVEENEMLKGVVEGLQEESAAMERRLGELERKLRRLRRRRGRRGVVIRFKVLDAPPVDPQEYM